MDIPDGASPGPLQHIQSLQLNSSDSAIIASLSTAVCTFGRDGNVLFVGKSGNAVIWAGRRASLVRLSTDVDPASAAWSASINRFVVADVKRNRLVTIDDRGHVSLLRLVISGQSPRLVLSLSPRTEVIGGERWLTDDAAALIGLYENGQLVKQFYGIDSIALSHNAFVGAGVVLALKDDSILAGQPTRHEIDLYSTEGKFGRRISLPPAWFTGPPRMGDEIDRESVPRLMGTWTPLVFLHYTGKTILAAFRLRGQPARYILRAHSDAGSVSEYPIANRPLCANGAKLLMVDKTGNFVRWHIYELIKA